MPKAARGLQVLLPASWPAFVVRIIGEFADTTTGSVLCRMIRIMVRGVPHDAYVLAENAQTLTVVVSNGGVLKIPREDAVGSHAWPVEPDTNPHSLAAVNAQWLTVICESERVAPVASFDEYRNVEPHFCSSGFLPWRRLHRRFRTYTFGETRECVLRPPFFLYCKLYFPLMDLMQFRRRGSAWMREAAAYEILHKCTPAVAPVCFYAAVHEEVGSSCTILEDLTALSAAAVEVASPGDGGGCVLDTALSICMRVLDQLAVLHGKFRAMTRAERHAAIREAEHRMYMKGKGGQPLPRIDPLCKELLVSMVDPKIFSTFWEYAIDQAKVDKNDERDRASTILRRVYDCFPARPGEEHHEDHTDADFSSLTLIHGNIQLEHIRLTHDPRHSPNCYLLDWKASGIGPREVDILQTLNLFVPHEQLTKELIAKLIARYCETYNIFYPDAKLTVQDAQKSLVAIAQLAFDCSRPGGSPAMPDGTVPDNAPWWLHFSPVDGKVRPGESHSKFLTKFLSILQSQADEASSFERALREARGEAN